MARTSKKFLDSQVREGRGWFLKRMPQCRWFTLVHITRISAGRSEIRDTLMDAYVQKNPRYQPRYHICQEELQSS